MDENIIKAARQNPRQALVELDRADCRESFYKFVQLAWHILEPTRPFVGGWAVKAVCDCLQAVTEGKIRRLLINIPPGCTKSMTTSVLWPAWEWGPGGFPAHRFINASYEKGLATRDMVRCRDLLTSPWYQERWPVELKDDENNKTKYDNLSTGWRLATSVGGALTGYRGDAIVVDDPHDVKRAESDVQREEALRWWTETLPTRFNDPDKSALVLMMQRLHSSDLSGHVLKNEADMFTKLILPMEYEPDRHCTIPEIGFSDPRKELGELLWPERFTARSVSELKATLSSRGGSYAVAGQLQQRPVSREGGLFHAKHVQYVDAAPEFGRRVRGWDLAASETSRSAYTTGVKMCMDDRGRIFIEHTERFRGSPYEVERKLKLRTHADGHHVVISLPQDPGQAGKAQKATLAAVVNGYNVHFSTESGDKISRAIPFAAQWEAGNVYIVRGEWNEPFLAELTMFPKSDFKDQVDGASRAYSYLVTSTEEDDIGTEPGKTVEDVSWKS